MKIPYKLYRRSHMQIRFIDENKTQRICLCVNNMPSHLDNAIKFHQMG